MRGKGPSQPDLFLLLSLLLVILAYPLLDKGVAPRSILTALMFIPVILATVRLSQIKGWLWQSVLLMSATVTAGIVARITANRIASGLRWGLLAAFLAFTVVGLFSYLRHVRSVGRAQLYTAASIYLLLGMLWFAAYRLIALYFPGSFLRGGHASTDVETDLLYFSLVTLSTVGYGDVTPLYGEVRILAALEAVTGVLDVAITVAILVSSYRRESLSPEKV